MITCKRFQLNPNLQAFFYPRPFRKYQLWIHSVSLPYRKIPSQICCYSPMFRLWEEMYFLPPYGAWDLDEAMVQYVSYRKNQVWSQSELVHSGVQKVSVTDKQTDGQTDGQIETYWWYDVSWRCWCYNKQVALTKNKNKWDVLSGILWMRQA